MAASDIDWTDEVLNPVTGCAMPASCAVRDHCYAAVMATRLRGRFGYPADQPMKPTWHQDKFEQLVAMKNKKTGRRIFVGSMCDLFGENIQDVWIERVLGAIQGDTKNTYIFLTKNPERYLDWRAYFTERCWIGTTVNKDCDLPRLRHVSWVNTPGARFVSFEPLYERLEGLVSNQYNYTLSKLNWFIIGAQSKPNVQPDPFWVSDLIGIALNFNIPVFMKDNLKVPDIYNLKGTRRQEFPQVIK